MDTESIIVWLKDKADRAERQSLTRVMKYASQKLTKLLEYERAESEGRLIILEETNDK